MSHFMRFDDGALATFSLVLDDMLAANAPLEDIEVTATSEDDLEVAAARLAAGGRTEDVRRLDDDLLLLFPPAVRTRLRIIARRMAAGDVRGARAAAMELVAVAPSDPRAYLALADTSDVGEPRETALTQGLAACGDVPELLQALVRARGVRLGLASVTSELERLRAVYAQQGRPDIYFALQAEVELANAHPAAAIGLWLKAADAAPDSDPYLRTAAAVAEQTGQLEMAQSLYRRLTVAHPDDQKLREALVRVTSAASAAVPIQPVVGP
jgi:hypothetical protein